ncbi:MAG: uracil-DNA glycosylase [Rhodospirillales bacterium]|nr:uracil-DNA glycosylase [Alphaproteobacteria bacterium]MCB1840515.1 uracil-DNA glycosylase [Alphaproteobacteria bacterium]MCB9977463.1 uracil-DNA glycosylase [Rhodospirillales bacterium]
MTRHQSQIAALEWYLDHGVSEPLESDPQDRTAWLNAQPLTQEKHEKIPPPEAPVTAPPAFLGTAEARTEAVRLAASAASLEELREAIGQFEGFAISKTATNLVFSDGNPKAPVMLVGEAPGADEDRLGKPFVGVSGQLLDKILKAIGLDRHSEDPLNSIYISNILNWRPPGNRNPSPAEIELAMPFIERHIQLARPRLLIFCGGVAAKALLKTEQGISRLRSRWHDYKTVTPELTRLCTDSIPALCTYHPSYLLRTPAQKKLSWADMLEIDSKIRAL